MIYCLNTDLFPNTDQSVEEIIYLDKNDFQWKISRVENGFFVKYLGDPYFIEKYFTCNLTTGEHITINNTNCIFIQDINFETFVEIRNLIKDNYTDDIWEVIQEMFEQRFEHDKSFLESEIIL
jgi:hypothetical protein